MIFWAFLGVIFGFFRSDFLAYLGLIFCFFVSDFSAKIQMPSKIEFEFLR